MPWEEAGLHLTCTFLPCLLPLDLADLPIGSEGQETYRSELWGRKALRIGVVFLREELGSVVAEKGWKMHSRRVTEGRRRLR